VIRPSCPGYRRYLKENGKRELKRFEVIIAGPDSAMLTAGLYSNCPSRENFD
jgi:hypothetical protein